MEEVQGSPLPVAQNADIVYPFDQALQQLLEGRKITRIAWNDKNTYGFLQGEEVWIRIKGENHRWILTIGDITAIDWIIIETN